MKDQNPPSGDAHDISGAGDRYEALLDVLEHQRTQKEQDEAREVAERRRRQDERRRPYWLVGVLLLITAWLWLFPPSSLRVDPPEPQPIQQEEEALRFAMYVQAQRIRAFRADNGRLPDRLEEAGPPLPGMRYTVLADGLYQLTGETDRLTLTYQSDLPLEEFLGTGEDVVDTAPEG